ncbi:MAG TPA: autotransporter-associated beta strand repeat-containing protein [Chthoniobacteraceae bacterium]|jgi:autotransporter-associated beta strand protein|nr:autotransporter-associated beta strand repeat-containing protein [Chthoniobacteraceae bacterium]
MRWILPLLSLAVVTPALAERAVYTGSLKAQNLANPSASNVVRVAEVIDLETGKIVTVALTGTKLNFTFNVGSEVECVIAKAVDAKKHATTAFAQAAAAIDSNGSKFALSTVLRGTDVTVVLGDAGSSHWPKSLVGTGSLVAAAGTDVASAPGGISLSTIALTLSLPFSQLANNSGGTLEQGAEVVGQAYRDAVAKSLHYPATASTATGVGAPTGDVATVGNAGNGQMAGESSGFRLYVAATDGQIQLNSAGYASLTSGASFGVAKTGVGNLVLATSIFTPPSEPLIFTPPWGGAVNLGSISSAATYSGASLVLNTGIPTVANPIGSSITLGGTLNTVAAGSLTFGSSASFVQNSSALTLTGANTYTGAVVVNAGTLTLDTGAVANLANLTGTGSLAITGVPGAGTATQLSAWTVVNPTTGLPMTIGSPEFNAFLGTGRFVGSIESHTLTFQPNVTTVPVTTEVPAAPVVDPAPAGATE